MSSTKQSSPPVIYLVTTTAIAIAFLVTGIGNIVPFEHIAHDMAHLGYPGYFLKILGTWKILAALAITLPVPHRLKTWAYAGMIFDLTGAALSRYFMGDAAPMVIIPLLICLPVMTSYFISYNRAANAG